MAAYEAGSGASADTSSDLTANIPGVPGEDYPIYAEVPESGFLCDGQVDGGYYADPEAECQAFHICTADGAGGLAKYSFLCPNRTLFNQNYFICDWWFNFDCSTAEELYSLNDEIAAERGEASGAAVAGSGEASGEGSGEASGSAPTGEYVQPPPDYDTAVGSGEEIAGSGEEEAGSGEAVAGSGEGSKEPPAYAGRRGRKTRKGSHTSNAGKALKGKKRGGKGKRGERRRTQG